MKISAIGSKAMDIGIWSALVAGWGFASYCVYDTLETRELERQKNMEYVKTHDSKRYDELIQKDAYPPTFDWKDEAQKVEMAIKMDSIARTNYALGMQAIRDSLANASGEK